MEQVQMDTRGSEDSVPQEQVAVRISLSKVRDVLLVVVGVLIATTFASQFIKAQHVGDDVTRFFDSDQKLNFPSLYKILALFTSSVVAAAISVAARRVRD